MLWKPCRLQQKTLCIYRQYRPECLHYIILGVNSRVYNAYGLSNNAVYYLGTCDLYECIRIIGSDYKDSRGTIDFTIYGNGGTVSAKGKNGVVESGVNRYIEIYMDGKSVYIKSVTGMSVSLIAIGAKAFSPASLPSGATQLSVTPYS